MNDRTLLLTESASGLSAHIVLSTKLAPENTAFLWDLLDEGREMSALHAMWTGPEISCPIPTQMLAAELSSRVLPPENATVTPQQGDLVLGYVPIRMWGGNAAPIFDLGLVYGPGARLLFPIGWVAGSVVGKVMQEEMDAVAKACNAIRRTGTCVLRWERA